MTTRTDFWHLAHIWHWNGRTSRWQYICLGLGLFAVKHFIDRLVATVGFDQPWSVADYIFPARSFAGLTMPAAQQRFYQTMLLIALPFTWAGIILTVRRLRDAELPLFLFVLFFLPVVNLFLFLALCIVPSAPDKPVEPMDARTSASPEPAPVVHEGRGAPVTLTYADAPERRRSVIDKLIPAGRLGGAAVAVPVPAAMGLAMTLLAVHAIGEYGWGLFVGLPFAIAVLSVLVYGWHGRRLWAESVGIAWLAILAWGLALFLTGEEGAICLLMAAPLMLIAALIGAAIAHSLSNSIRGCDRLLLLAIMTFGASSVILAESLDDRCAPLLSAVTSIDVAAPPERVWPNVIRFPDLHPPDEWLFRVGVAHPIRARIEGEGPGAVRYCEFSTGAFVEPIEVWDEPRRLAFAVTDQPVTMREWSPYSDVNPPHLHGYFNSRAGEFRLIELPDGRTRLVGTTWYHQHMQPLAYWRLWSDAILHRIHHRVLQHIKHRAEADVALAGASKAASACLGGGPPIP